MTDTTILALMNILVGVIFIALAVPLIRRRIKMNELYGVRFRQSFTSDENWYAINEYGGKLLALNGLILIGVGVTGLFLPSTTAVMFALAFAPLTVVVTCIESYRFARSRPTN